MDEKSTQPTPSPDFNKIDLSQLQGFSFGTQWTQDKAAGRDTQREARPRRDRDGEPGLNRRDRRGFKKPIRRDGTESAGGPGGGRLEPGRSGSGRSRAPFEGGRRGGPRVSHAEAGPYESQVFQVTFYPEDTSFATLAKTIRSSCRTIELFEIARTVIGKSDRFVVVLQRKPAAGAEAARPGPVAVSVPDGIPFETEEAAVAHVLGHHLEKFFDVAEVDVDPPKGNFQMVNRCGVTGELLGPPNYHLYSRIVQQHHAKHVTRMSFEAFRGRIESVRDPELIQQWLQKMSKATRYTWKATSPGPATVLPAATEASPAEAQSAPDAAESSPGVAEAAPEGNEDGGEKPAATPSGDSPAIHFDTLEEARAYLMNHARERVVRLLDHARLHGRVCETLPDGEVRRAIEGALAKQHRFPLETANALRGRLRREGFTIFKRGSKGISYVCAVKRRFRVPGQVFAEGITRLIDYIEEHPMVHAGILPEKLLGIPPSPSAAEGTHPPQEATLPQEQREQLTRLQGDLRWLVHEGYVTEFIDGSLFAPVPMVEARKREVEAEEHQEGSGTEDPAETPTESSAAPAEESPPVEEPAPAVAVPANVPVRPEQPDAS